MFYLCYSQLRHPPSTSTTQHHIRRHQEDGGSWWSHNDDEYQQQWHQWLGNDTGTGNTLTIRSRVCTGTGTGLSLPNPHNTVPVSTVSWVFRLPTFRSGEWSYDLVDSLTLTTQHFKTTPTTHHHHSIVSFFVFSFCFCKPTNYVSSFSGSKLLVMTDNDTQRCHVTQAHTMRLHRLGPQ